MQLPKLTFFLFASAILLTSCGAKYKVDADITPERLAELKQDIKDYKQAIEDYVPKDQEIALEPIVGLGRAYEEMGDYGKAIDLYLDVLDEHGSSKALIHNLGRDYESVGEYDLAVAQYQKIIDEYFDSGYLYDITWAYIRAGNKQGAEAFFNDWQLKFRKTDEQTQEAIKNLSSSSN